MSAARVRCRTCGQRAAWCVVWLEDVELGGREGGRWLHAADAIRSPWQPQSDVHAHPVDPVREDPARGPGSTHGSTHGGLLDYVTHATRTAPTASDVTPAQTSHGSTHATHGAGAVTFSPPSSWGET